MPQSLEARAHVHTVLRLCYCLKLDPIATGDAADLLSKRTAPGMSLMTEETMEHSVAVMQSKGQVHHLARLRIDPTRIKFDMEQDHITPNMLPLTCPLSLLQANRS